MKMEKFVEPEKKEGSSVTQEFSRFAKEYGTYNTIQVSVAEYLATLIPHKRYQNMIDIGAGNGTLFYALEKKNISYNTFIALDASLEMLEQHPHTPRIKHYIANFNDGSFLKLLEQLHPDILLSASALQWSTNLHQTTQMLSQLQRPFYGALFTSNTFKTLHQTAKISSPIYTKEHIIDAFESTFSTVTYHIKHYRLFFESTYEMLHYIKRSGVSSGEKRLGYQEVKALIASYPLSYLEFEVIFIEAK